VSNKLGLAGIPRRVAVLALGVIAASAAAPAQPRARDAEAFAAFRALAGVWRGEGVSEGLPYRDFYRFEEAALGRYVRAEYAMQSVDGAQIWHDFGAYGIHPETGRFFTHGFGSDGATAESVLYSFEPGRWRFRGHTDGSAVFRNYRFALDLNPDETLTALTEIPERGAWRTLFQGTYRREA
jgi:hypothetical protein